MSQRDGEKCLCRSRQVFGLVQSPNTALVIIERCSSFEGKGEISFGRASNDVETEANGSEASDVVAIA